VKVDPKLGGQWKVMEKVPCLVVNGRWKKNTFSPLPTFPPINFYLNFQFPPLILRFYYTMVLGHYSCIPYPLEL
jgi:hypothetical protein